MVFFEFVFKIISKQKLLVFVNEIDCVEFFSLKLFSISSNTKKQKCNLVESKIFRIKGKLLFNVFFFNKTST